MEGVGRRSLRVLLASIYYAPEVTANAPYATGVAEHWASQGHRVTVVTGVPHYPQWRRAPVQQMPGGNPAVVRYQHFVPHTHNASTRLAYEASWLLSALRGLAFGAYDVAVGITPTLSGAVLAGLAGKRFGIPFGLVFQDLIGPAAKQSGYQGSRSVAHYVGLVEKAAARKATSVAIIADNFRGYLEMAGVTPERIVRVRNWAHEVQVTETRAVTRRRLGWPNSSFVCLHAGNMGRKQGLDNVLQMAKLVASDDVRVVLAGDGNDRERLAKRVADERIGNVSFILQEQSAPQFQAMLMAADVLILNQRPSVEDMALPSKLAAYFASGRPVLAAVAEGSSAALEVTGAHAGIVVAPGDPEALRRGVLGLRTDEGVRLALGEKGRAYSKAYLAMAEALPGYDEFLSRLIRADQLAGPLGDAQSLPSLEHLSPGSPSRS